MNCKMKKKFTDAQKHLEDNFIRTKQENQNTDPSFPENFFNIKNGNLISHNIKYSCIFVYNKNRTSWICNKVFMLDMNKKQLKE